MKKKIGILVATGLVMANMLCLTVFAKPIDNIKNNNIQIRLMIDGGRDPNPW